MPRLHKPAIVRLLADPCQPMLKEGDEMDEHKNHRSGQKDFPMSRVTPAKLTLGTTTSPATAAVAAAVAKKWCTLSL
jgi:hypothetical protein